MNYAIKILQDQKKLLTDKIEQAEGFELKEYLKRRLTDITNALKQIKG